MSDERKAMTYLIRGIRIPSHLDQKEALGRAAAKRLHTAESPSLEIVKRSLDARGSTICFAYDIAVPSDEKLPFDVYGKPELRVRPLDVRRHEPVVVGAGPAGLFAALRLVEYGFEPTIYEMGKPVEKRVASVARFFTDGILDQSSNIQFGEGGAGTFSDGKLTTRIKSEVRSYVVDRLIEFGAPEEIRFDYLPHVGTDLIRRVVVAMRRFIEARGGVYRFGTKLTGLSIRDRAVASIEIDGRREQDGQPVFLAVGNAARESFAMLANVILVEPKPFAVGMRMEHPRSVIDDFRYGRGTRRTNLGPASYNLTCARTEGRGVYTFCMCPGGVVIPASSEEGGLVVNGMSEHARAGTYSNSAVVVTVDGRDFGDDPVGFQRAIERTAFEIGGRGYAAPAQTIGSFLTGKAERTRGSSYPRMLANVDMARLFTPDLADALRHALASFARSFASAGLRDEFLAGLLIAPETRTSSPLRIVRGDSMASVSADNLYPIGEGAGYAGGIVSSAVDGIRAVDAFVAANYP